MQRRPFPEATLDELRGIGDPRLDGLEPGDIPSYFRSVAADGLDVAFENSGDKASRDEVMRLVLEDTTEALEALRSYGVSPAVVIRRARDLFTYYGDEICASLLLAGLPDSYATAWGARVLVAHGDLVWALPRRVRETAMFLMTVLSNYGTQEGDDGSATIVRTCAALRLFHQMLRVQLGRDESAKKAIGEENETPINQEDLLGTLLTFTVTTFGVLDHFGVQWTDDDREAYLMLWDIVGAALGIGTQTVYEQLSNHNGYAVPHPLRPQTVDTATRLLDQLHGRQWLPVPATIEGGRPFPWSGLVPGRMLADALVAALTEAMPAAKKMWPAMVMRELAPSIVQSRLGLDGSGLSSYAARWVAERSRYAKYARSATLRMMANDITRHAMQSFLRAAGPPFVIPGLDLRELTTSAVVRPNLLELK